LHCGQGVNVTTYAIAAEMHPTELREEHFTVYWHPTDLREEHFIVYWKTRCTGGHNNL
jgi:hypothetical protein